MTTPTPNDANPTGTGVPPVAAPVAPTPVTPAPVQATVTSEPGDGKTPFQGEYDPAKAARLIENLRSDLDAQKTKNTDLESKFSGFMDNFSKLFGAGDQQALTPEQIAQKAEKSAQDAREASTKLAVFQSAGKHGADPDALLDSASFVRAISKLDPAADTFAANVDSAIKKAVEGNTRLQAQATTPPVPPKGGFDMSGGSGGKRQLTAAEVTHLHKTNPEALVKANEDGLLKDYFAS